jgi:hypothetical protein
MNERIKELKKEAFSQTEWEELDYDRILEKFAELLLFECIKLAVFRGDKETGKAIKDHFELE